MKEFFHGWRRKAGVAMLVMALAFMGGWIRSLYVFDMLQFPTPYGTQAVISAYSRIGFVSWVRPNRMGKSTEPIWGSGTHRFSSIENYFGSGSQPHLVTIPYWPVTISLTLLSAYLILWKPRKQQPTASKPHA